MIVSWDHCGDLLLARESGQSELVSGLECVGGVPQIDDARLPTVVPRMLLLPMELLLLRSVVLPLSHPRFIDDAILGQELEEQAGIDAEQWWLAWQMDRLDEACAGVVLAMPIAMRQQLAGDALWSQSTTITADGWVRMQTQLAAHTVGDAAVVAVVDADDEGVFFGCWRSGCWLGMRRLNQRHAQENAPTCSVIVTQVVRSLEAMGWRDDAPVIGRLDTAWHEALMGCDEAGEISWQGQVVASLPARLDANIAAARADVATLNFRHGRWSAASTGLVDWKLWRRSAALMVMLCLVWYGQQQFAISGLQQQSSLVEGKIAQAFHRGLPDQAVMLDPLGQLQVAANGISGGVDRQQLLREMAVVAAVHTQIAWSLRGLQLQGGVVRMRGSTTDLASLNKIHHLLQKAVGHKVIIEDTDLRKGSVGFRMRWS
ncbi:MAG: hypothetical protein R8J85_09480 [Mariprofundales bacterium]